MHGGNAICPSAGPIPAPAQEIAARFCMENVNSPDYEKIKELDVLNSYDQLLIRRNMDEKDRGNPNVPNCYEVTTRMGHPIIKVVQTVEFNPNNSPGKVGAKPFRLSLFDCKSGNEIMKVVAKQGADSAVISVRQKGSSEYHGIGKILRVKEGTGLKGPDYNVRGSNGKVVLRVKGKCCLMYKKTNFDICTSDSSHCYGKIFKDPEDAEVRHRTRDYITNEDAVYRLRFPIDISMVSKALILASVLVIDYDYFDCGAREAKTDFLLMTLAMAFVTFLILLVVIVITVSIATKFALLANRGIGGTNGTRNELDGQFELITVTPKIPVV